MKLHQLYQKLFTQKNVQYQLRSLFISTVLIPVLLAGSIIVTLFYHHLAQKYENLSESEANRVRSVMMTTTLYIQDIYENLSTDEELRELLSTDYQSPTEAKYAFQRFSHFTKIMENTASLTELSLYVEPDVLKHDTSISYFRPIDDEIRSAEWFQKASKTKSNFWESTERIGRNGVSYWELNYYCHIPIPKTSSYAVLVLTISNDYLRNLIQENEYDIYISVNDDPVFYSSDRSYPGNSFPVALESFSEACDKTGVLSLFGKKTITSIKTLCPTKTSDQIYIAAANPDAIPAIHSVQLALFLVLLFALLFSSLLIYLFSGYFSSRIQTLRLAMHKVSNNDYEIVNSIQGDDELSTTFQDLILMVEKLKKTEAQIYESQIKEQMLSNQQQQMELKLLSNQINPHFLYNTLETIRMKAFAEGNLEVANAIKLLGKSMRYVLENTKTTATTLDKEIDYVKVYLAIQKMRFGERLEYDIQVADDLELPKYQILPLLIQPIVENAVSHGIVPTGRKGHVILKLYKKEDLLIADTMDDGDGLTEEELNDVITHLSTPRTDSPHGIGLYNINSRIHLYYGSSYGLTIQSEPKKGTLVSLAIPLHNLTEE